MAQNSLSLSPEAGGYGLLSMRIRIKWCSLFTFSNEQTNPWQILFLKKKIFAEARMRWKVETKTFLSLAKFRPQRVCMCKNTLFRLVSGLRLYEIMLGYKWSLFTLCYDCNDWWPGLVCGSRFNLTKLLLNGMWILDPICFQNLCQGCSEMNLLWSLIAVVSTIWWKSELNGAQHLDITTKCCWIVKIKRTRRLHLLLKTF